jgi:hypothetical protein
MKKIDLGQAIQILANIGVIAGIGVLAFEIRQSNVQANAASLLENGGQMSERMYSVGSDAEAANIYYQGLRDFGQLAPVDQLRFDLLIRSQLIRLEVGYEAFGELGTNLMGGLRRRTVEGLFARNGFREWWNYTDRGTLPRPIAEYLQELEPESQ